MYTCIHIGITYIYIYIYTHTYTYIQADSVLLLHSHDLLLRLHEETALRRGLEPTRPPQNI